MWRKLTIDDRADHYLSLQLEREKKEEKEEKELKAKRCHFAICLEPRRTQEGGI